MPWFFPLLAFAIWPLLALLVLCGGLTLIGLSALFFCAGIHREAGGQLASGVGAIVLLALPSLSSLIWISRLLLGRAKWLIRHRAATIVVLWLLNGAAWWWLMEEFRKLPNETAW